jgi:hypothetical protein
LHGKLGRDFDQRHAAAAVLDRGRWRARINVSRVASAEAGAQMYYGALQNHRRGQRATAG